MRPTPKFAKPKPSEMYTGDRHEDQLLAAPTLLRLQLTRLELPLSFKPVPHLWADLCLFGPFGVACMTAPTTDCLLLNRERTVLDRTMRNSGGDARAGFARRCPVADGRYHVRTQAGQMSHLRQGSKPRNRSRTLRDMRMQPTALTCDPSHN